MMQLNVSHAFLPKHNSMRASIVMDHFGIDFEQGRHVIAEGLELPIRPGDVVLFTGPSGSGKSSLLRAAADELRKTAGTEGDPVVDIDRLDLGTQILIDAVPGPVDEALHLLSACGLGEAQVLLRTPAELSEGQRYRFRLALAVAQPGEWVLADEFTATLDRTLARVIAYNVQRLARRTGKGFLLATTHEDVVEDLAPDVHAKCRMDGEVEVVAGRERVSEGERVSRLFRACSSRHRDAREAASAATGVKKKRFRLRRSCGSVRRPEPTGRTSLGGIIGATASDQCGS